MTIEHTSELLALWVLAACVVGPIVGRVLRACDLRDQAARQSESGELSNGASDFIHNGGNNRA